MQYMKIKTLMLPALFIGLMVACTGMALAQRAGSSNAPPVMKINLSGEIERPAGNVAIEKAGAVSPGEVINYTINSHNEGPSAAREFKAIGPIPAKTVYVEGSAKAEGAVAFYSIDGSKSYSLKPMIEQRQADGSMKLVPAPVSMYTHVRFEWNNTLAADTHCSASYRVRVK